MYQSNQNKYDELSDAYDETRPFSHNRQMVYIKTRRSNHLVYLFKRGLSTKKLFVLFSNGTVEHKK